MSIIEDNGVTMEVDDHVAERLKREDFIREGDDGLFHPLPPHNINTIKEASEEY